MFSINTMIILIMLGGYISSRIFKRAGLPNVLGMIVFGIALAYFYGDRFPGTIWELEPFLKSLALIIILLRAGLSISTSTLKKTGRTAVMIGLIPCFTEGIALSFAVYHIMGFDLVISCLTGFMLSAVSPAVVIPSMLDLKSRGYGKRKEVPTIIIAGASLDDILIISIFSALLGISLGESEGISELIMMVPLSIILGILMGILIGSILYRYFKKRYENIRATEKVLIILSISLLFVQVGDIIHIASFLGIMTIGFILLWKSQKISSEIASKLSKWWIFAELFLFVLIGMALDVDIALEAGLKGIMIVFTGLIFRSIGVIIATIGFSLNKKEILFCVFAYIPKATVQAALGGIALSHGIPEGGANTCTGSSFHIDNCSHWFVSHKRF